MTLYERLELLRKKEGKSQRAIEQELGFSTGSYGKCKTNMPSHSRLQKLADYFGVTVDYLLGSENYKMDNETHTWDFVIDNKDMKILVEAMSDNDNADRLIAYAKKLIELKNMEDIG